MDKDGDGKASWEEAMMIGATEKNKAEFEQMDINKDGFIEVDELTTFFV